MPATRLCPPPDSRWHSGVRGELSVAASTHPTVLDPASPTSPSLSRVARLLERNAPLHGLIDPKLGRAISTALANPGRLFRAGLTFEAAQACGLPDTQAESLACALEYFHVASLLFDDLPMMDNASMRRGEISAHLRHGEAATVLAALALITRAYALTGAAITPAPGERQGPALALIERCLGTGENARRTSAGRAFPSRRQGRAERGGDLPSQDGAADPAFAPAARVPWRPE